MLTSAKKILHLVLFGNIYIAIATVCLIQSTIVQLQLKDHLPVYSLLAFFATLFVYNFQRAFYTPQQNTSLHSIRRKWIFTHPKTVKLLALTGAVGVACCMYFMQLHTMVYLAPLLFFSIAYFIPFIKLRKSVFFKLFTLVMVWSIVTALVPMLLNNIHIFTFVGSIHLLLRISFMCGICIPFDLRDLEIDKADQISTIPQLLGEYKTRILAFSFMLLYLVLIFIEHHCGILSNNAFIVLLFTGILNTIIVLYSKANRSEYYYVALIDGTMILQGGLLLLVH